LNANYEREFVKAIIGEGIRYGKRQFRPTFTFSPPISNFPRNLGSVEQTLRAAQQKAKSAFEKKRKTSTKGAQSQ